MAARKPWGMVPSRVTDDKPPLEMLVRSALLQARRNNDQATAEDLTDVLDLLRSQGARPGLLPS